MKYKYRYPGRCIDMPAENEDWMIAEAISADPKAELVPWEECESCNGYGTGIFPDPDVSLDMPNPEDRRSPLDRGWKRRTCTQCRGTGQMPLDFKYKLHFLDLTMWARNQPWWQDNKNDYQIITPCNVLSTHLRLFVEEKQRETDEVALLLRSIIAQQLKNSNKDK